MHLLFLQKKGLWSVEKKGDSGEQENSMVEALDRVPKRSKKISREPRTLSVKNDKLIPTAKE